MCKIWGVSIGFSYVNIEKTLFQHETVQKLPHDFAKKHCVIPLYQLGKAITIATADPSNLRILKSTEMITKSPISPVFSLPHEIEDAIEIEYQTGNSLDELIHKLALSSFDSRSTITVEQLEKIVGDKAVIEFTRGKLLLAVKEKQAIYI